MKRVITYGTYDLLHYGHIRLLERAKTLGDYLIVGITSDGFDRARGKINVQQSLIERIDAVRATGLADQIVVEEYEGQKIDDIVKYGVSIFAIGSDWKGRFDYLKEYCEVVYLERTQGVSSSELRAEKRKVRIGLIGGTANALSMMEKFERESHYVNGVEITGVCTHDDNIPVNLRQLPMLTRDEDEIIRRSDAVYIISQPRHHYGHIRKALEQGKHVLFESPIATDSTQFKELMSLASRSGCVLMEGIKTAYSTAYNRMVALVKSGRIGDVVSIDSVCTSIYDVTTANEGSVWNSITAWGPTAMLPIFQILGTEYRDIRIVTKRMSRESDYDLFTKVMFEYPHAVASLKVGQGVKSEGSLVISGTKGYVYVPAPWWKTDYFELRYENPANNKRYFYHLDGEGIRNEIFSFTKAIEGQDVYIQIDHVVTEKIASVCSDYYCGKKIVLI